MAEYRQVKRKYTSVVTKPTPSRSDPSTEAVQSGPRGPATSGFSEGMSDEPLSGYGESVISGSSQGVVVSQDDWITDDHGHDHGDGVYGGLKETPTNVELFYNTMSCPCDTKVVGLGTGLVGCERNNFGVIDIINPISVYNHKINSLAPKINDKWRCVGVKCKKGDFKWDTLHVVSVIESTTNYNNSSLLNSITSTSNCYIPKSDNYTVNNERVWTEDLLREYSDLMTAAGIPNPGHSGFNIQENLGHINGNPIFETSDQAWWYNKTARLSPDPNSIIHYSGNGITGFVAGNLTGEEKLIKSFVLNKKDLLKNIIGDFETMNKNSSAAYNSTIDSNGGFLNVEIKGINKPTFTLKIEDSSNCSVVKEKIKNITNNNYNIKVEIPALALGKVSETYTVELSLAGDTKFDLIDGVPTVGIVKTKIYQYKRPTFTIANTASTITDAATTSNTTAFSGNVMSEVSSPKTFTPETHVTTITRSSGTRNYYIKQLPKFEDLITKGNIIRKTIVENNGKELLIAPNPETLDGTLTVPLYDGDVAVGMSMEGKIVKTKEVRAVIDIDKNDDPCYDCDEDIYTNKFEIINSPNDIFENMVVTGVDVDGNSFTTVLESIDATVEGFSCITLANKYILKKSTILTFTYEIKTEVTDVVDNGQGQVIRLSSGVLLPAKTDITFENGDTSYIEGTIKHTISGREEITITTTIDEVKFGREDVTFTLNVDDFVTDTPIVKDINLVIGKDTPRSINFAENSGGYTDALTVTVVNGPKNGGLSDKRPGGSLYQSTLIYVPNPSFTGKDQIEFTIGDGVVTSESKTAFITIK